MTVLPLGPMLAMINKVPRFTVIDALRLNSHSAALRNETTMLTRFGNLVMEMTDPSDTNKITAARFEVIKVFLGENGTKKLLLVDLFARVALHPFVSCFEAGCFFPLDISRFF